jgi:hypothetical protein
MVMSRIPYWLYAGAVEMVHVSSAYSKREDVAYKQISDRTLEQTVFSGFSLGGILDVFGDDSSEDGE